ncbi:MAG: murein biosynthesis integral membrane protein MurJ [Holophagaceae bacterium]|uniref:Probable lipid II flippase MurJ n=1 Tax=Candidatus Geothrix odensensis TaxID=2954440 RepID=A0A936F160_9BACT|nr:murein biosynthesis integral membrane protein MurJ [Candidatus Geothrix odensensis]
MSGGPGAPSLLRSAGIVGLMTLLSRLTGLAQTFFLSHVLGAGAAADAYVVAFRLPNLLRRFTAEGTMTAAFLPTLAEAEATEGEAALKAVAARFLGTLLAILLGGVAVVLLVMGPLAGLLMGGRPEAQSQLTALLGRIMFPYLALVSLTAGFAGLLNLRHRFALAASVSVFWNLAFIAFGWSALKVLQQQGPVPFETVAVVCACAVLAGGVLQLLVVLPAVRKEGFGLAFGLHLKDPWVLKALKRMGPGLLAAGIYPINALISTMLASRLPNGAQTVLYNSGMMGEMVMGLFAMSLATASLPALSRQAEARDWPAMHRSLIQSISASALLVLPASVGLAVLARPICALLFRTGAYGPAAADWTALTLVFQSLGLVFVAAQRLGNQALYALKDYRGPATLAGFTLLLNVALSLALLSPLGTGGLALANGLASLAGLLLLLVRLRPRLPGLDLVPLLWATAKALAACVLMGLLAWAGARFLALDEPHAFTRLALGLRLLPLVGLCALAYGLAAAGLGHPEARELAAKILRRLRRG